MSSVADLAKLHEASDVDRLNRRIAGLEAENAELRRRIAAWVDAPLPKQRDARWLAVYGAAYMRAWGTFQGTREDVPGFVARADALVDAELEVRSKGEAMTTRADRLRNTINAYTEAMTKADVAFMTERERYRCVASDMMTQAISILAEAEKERDDLAAEVERLRADLVAIGAAAGTEEWAVREYGLAGLPDTIAQWRGEAAQAEALRAKVARYDAPIECVREAAGGDAKEPLGLDALRSVVDKLARLARYEAPGPALLEDDNDLECPLCEQRQALDSKPHDHFQAVDCMRAGAKQQHARCVAVVERAIASAEQEIVDAKKDARAAIDNNAPRYERDECEARQHAASGFLAGVRACLAALKDGAK
jgi:hypothetical protein